MKLILITENQLLSDRWLFFIKSRQGFVTLLWNVSENWLLSSNKKDPISFSKIRTITPTTNNTRLLFEFLLLTYKLTLKTIRFSVGRFLLFSAEYDVNQSVTLSLSSKHTSNKIYAFTKCFSAYSLLGLTIKSRPVTWYSATLSLLHNHVHVHRYMSRWRMCVLKYRPVVQYCN